MNNKPHVLEPVENVAKTISALNIPESLELFQLELQALFCGTEKIVTILSSKTPVQSRIESLQDSIHSGWTSTNKEDKKIGFQSIDGIWVFIDLEEVIFLSTQMLFDSYKKEI